jgi:Domain of unknown function (DUF4349)
MRAWRSVAVLGAAGLALLVGCGGGPGNSSGNAFSNASGGAARQDAAAAAPAAKAPAATDATDAPLTQGAPVVSTRALIRTAELSVAVDDVSGQAQRAAQITADAGGEVFSDQRTTGDERDRRTADLVLKVPPGKLGQVLDELSKLGTEEARHTATDDVTAEVADVDSRVRSARASLERLRGLYAHAGSITEITGLEGQISQRESDLEALEARQRALAGQTATATVTLHLHGRALAAAPAPGTRPTGFVSALRAGWHAFAVSVAWLVTVLGAVLPFAILAAAAGYLVWRLTRRARPRQVPPAATTGQ